MIYEKQILLVVDDNDLNRELLIKRLNDQEHQADCAASGTEALAKLAQHNFSLVLLDIEMPELNGIQVLQKIKADQRLKSIPVIMVTSRDDQESIVRCIELGAEDHISKPINPVILNARVNACLEKKRLYDESEHYREALRNENFSLQDVVREKAEEITAAQLAAIFSMSKLAESKDPETGAHLERLREYCRILAEDLMCTPEYRGIIDQNYADTIYAASPLHDVGKVGIPDNVLLKPGKLNPEEWRIMQTHSSIGADTLRAVHEQYPNNTFIQIGIEIAQSHHEKWDGSGYPHALRGSQIPLSARILVLGDVYDALTSKRCYKDAFSHEKSREIILEGRGSHFDPDMVAAFLRTENKFCDIRSRYQDLNDPADFIRQSCSN